MRYKVAVGLSGGVDSAVSAALLVDQGYDVTGVFLICYQGPGCRTNEDRKDALDVALKLKIPFDVLDFRKEYQAQVLDYFKAEYQAGRTPNPDVVCNKEIKFGLFYDWAMKKGFDYMATGHYACVRSTQETRNKKQETRFELQISKDKKKDQTYFLYQLREEQLTHILFPIGGMTKDQVRAEAINRKLTVAKKPDSQGICFVGEVSVPEFLKTMGVKEKPGKVLLKPHQIFRQAQDFTSPLIKGEDKGGVVVGEHKGVWFYTIGQRLARLPVIDDGLQREYSHNLVKAGYDQSNMPPLYVIGKVVEKNEVMVGTREQCMRREFEVGEVHYVNKDTRSQMLDSRGLEVRLRHQGKLIPSTIKNLKSKILVRLNEPAFGVAPGQSCVFYKGEICLGGGVIV